jgi:hypothetical protein
VGLAEKLRQDLATVNLPSRLVGWLAGLWYNRVKSCFNFGRLWGGGGGARLPPHPRPSVRIGTSLLTEAAGGVAAAGSLITNRAPVLTFLYTESL